MKNRLSSSSSSQTSSKKRQWSWDQYLQDERDEAAPLQLFSQFQTFPSSRNGFKVGMRLEGIDPMHPSMFCVLSVCEVIGFRLRLHIDGYGECYDFWVNADSADIRPVGWCGSTGHELQPPKGQDRFLWEEYLQSCGSAPAPPHLFRPADPAPPQAFAVGMKLEAIDRKNPCLVCVASVADVMDARFLVHFDNWDDTYDYWCDSSSPYIHPVGWCESNGRPLTAPQGHPNPETFVWEKYMTDTETSAAPSHAFSMRAPHGFRSGMKLEVVDRRNPVMIRVASISDTDDYRVKIHFDGWSEKFDFWVDSDLPDLHPVGWCSRTGHPLEPPPNPSDVRGSTNQGVCPTPGCRGVGHIKGAKYTGHHSAFGCPYSEMNMKKGVVLPDRLGAEKQITLVPVHFVQKMKRECEEEEEKKEEEDCSRVTDQRVGLKEEDDDDGGDDGDDGVRRVVRGRRVCADPGRERPLCWDQHCKLLPGVSGVSAAGVEHWTVDQVARFILSLPGCEDHAQRFREQQIDGKALLLLTQRDLVKIMSVKLGPALKIYNSILMFKHAAAHT